MSATRKGSPRYQFDDTAPQRAARAVFAFLLNGNREPARTAPMRPTQATVMYGDLGPLQRFMPPPSRVNSPDELKTTAPRFAKLSPLGGTNRRPERNRRPEPPPRASRPPTAPPSMPLNVKT